MKNTESDGIGPLSPVQVGGKRKLPETGHSAGLDVRPIWLSVSHSERYLFLEDKDTGDVLLPLIYMKGMFEANYSRKLSSLKHRLVSLPENINIERPRGFVYWQWAFESPHEVKVLVRKMLGEENTPQGHLRLILLPIVFNAMAQKAKLRQSPFFRELYKAVKASTYWPLLKLPSLDDDISVNDLLKDQDDSKRSSPFFPVPFSPAHREEIPSKRSSESENFSQRSAQTGAEQNPVKRSKSNSSFGKSSDSILSISQPGLTLGSLNSNQEKSDGSMGHDQWKRKKSGEDSNPSEWGLGKDQPATLDLMNLGQPRWADRRGGVPERGSDLSLEMASRDRVSNSSAEEPPLFHGPYDLQRTITKYCLSYEAAEENENKKKSLNGLGQVSALEDASGVKFELDFLKMQGEEIKGDVLKLRTECQEQISGVCHELRQIKHCLNDLISILSKNTNANLKGLDIVSDEKHLNSDNVNSNQVNSRPQTSHSQPNISHLHSFAHLQPHSQPDSVSHPHSHPHPTFPHSSSSHREYHSMADYLGSRRNSLILSASHSLPSTPSSMSSFSSPGNTGRSREGQEQNLNKNFGTTHSTLQQQVDTWTKGRDFHSNDAQGIDLSQSQSQGHNKSNQNLSQLLNFQAHQTLPTSVLKLQPSQQNHNTDWKSSLGGNAGDHSHYNNMYSHHSNMKFHQLMPETSRESNLSPHWVLANSHNVEPPNNSQTNQTKGMPSWGNKNL